MEDAIAKPTMQMGASPIRFGVSDDFGITWKSIEVGRDALYAQCLLGLGYSLKETAEEVGITYSQTHETTRGTLGLYGTLKKLGIEDWKTFMNEARLEQTHRGLTGIARKVLEAVPRESPWSTSEVCSEMFRLNKTKPDMRIVQGCLDSLKHSGLIAERGGKYVQLHRFKPIVAAMADALEVKEAIVEKPIQAPAAPVTVAALIQPVVSPTKDEPLKRMAELASKIRSFASELEDIALDIAARDQKNSADTAKLRQLQSLLRDIAP